MRHPRSKLFTPGTATDRFAKAAASDADLVVLDLEDAVAPSAKAAARRAVATALSSELFADRRCAVRINGLSSADWLADLDAVVTDHLDEIHVPKVEDARTLTTLADVLTAMERQRGIGAIGIVATIETPIGFERLPQITAATERLRGLQLGLADLVAALPVAPDREQLGWFRLRLVSAAAAAGLPAMDSAHLEHRDIEGFRRASLEARACGMSGKSCIHPAQVPIANEVFDVAAGRDDAAIVAAFDAAVALGEGVVEVDGTMVDRPVAEAARRRLEARG